jgi:hypothetical protein
MNGNMMDTLITRLQNYYSCCDVVLKENTIAIIKLLLENRAEVDARNKCGQTPLHFASWLGCTQITKLLLDYGAKVNIKDCEGLSPYQSLKTIINKCQCHFNGAYYQGCWAEFASSRWGELSALLASHGADVSSDDRKAWASSLSRPYLESTVESGRTLADVPTEVRVNVISSFLVGDELVTKRNARMVREASPIP